MATPAENPLVRYRVVYCGDVQGVGFRMTACGIAGRFRVSGWVRNLANGDVELETQGAADELRGFLAAIDEEFRGNIRGANRDEAAVREGERGFAIRR